LSRVNEGIVANANARVKCLSQGEWGYDRTLA